MGGLYGVAAKEDCVADLFYGTDYHSHLGTRRGGLAVLDVGADRTRHPRHREQPSSAASSSPTSEAHGRQRHRRHQRHEDQPLLIGSHLGTYRHRHRRPDRQSRRAGRRRVRTPPPLRRDERRSVNPTEVVATLINRAEQLRRRHPPGPGGDRGLLLAAAADRRRHLCRARPPRPHADRRSGGARAPSPSARRPAPSPTSATTSSAFLGPGEDRTHHARGLRDVCPPGHAHADLRLPLGLLRLSGLELRRHQRREVRNRCGAALAPRDDVAVDLVAGIPDSGIGHAIGYANAAACLPYRRPFVKYTPTWPRSFMPQDQRVRDLVARMKLIPIAELIQGQRLLFCEDSIVRGTQLRDTIRRLYDCGAREVHMRPACPPLIYGCKFLNFSRSRSSSISPGARRSRSWRVRTACTWTSTPMPDRPGTRPWSRASASACG